MTAAAESVGPSLAGATGSVTVTYRVNAFARNEHIVRDQAIVQVGTGPWQPTGNVPENPLPGPLPQTDDDTPFWLYGLVAGVGTVALVAATVILFRRKPARSTGGSHFRS